MIKDRMRNNTIKQKSMLFFVIFVLASVLFSLSLYLYNTNLVKKSVLEKNNEQVEFFVSSLDGQLATAAEMTYNLMFDRALSFLIYPNDLLDNYDLSKGYMNQQERLTHLKLSSPLIVSAKIYLPRVNRIISDTAIEEMKESDLVFVEKAFEKADSRIVYDSDVDELFIATTDTYCSSDSQIPNILFYVKLDVQKIRELLSNYNLYPNSYSFIKTADGVSISPDINLSLIRELEAKIKDDENFFEEDAGKAVSEKVDLKSGRYQVTRVSSEYLGTFIQVTPYNHFFNELGPNRYILLCYVLVMLCFAYIFSRYLDVYVHKPLVELVQQFRSVEQGNLKPTDEKYVDKSTEFTYVFKSFEQMKDRLSHMISEVYVQTNLTQLAQMKQLQSQINPHFLYNSFFSLNRKLKRGDSQSAAELANHLGQYFKFLARSDNYMISLNEEVLHAKSYASIQQIRFRDRISIDFDEVPMYYQNLAVPRLILQPLIENAFKYGLENREEDGLLEVHFIPGPRELIILVEDNGEDLSDEVIDNLQKQLLSLDDTKNTGLINIHKRLEIFFGGSSGLLISRSELGGLKIEIHIYKQLQNNVV